MGGSAITVTGLHKWFGRTAALAGLDLDVPAGTVMALLGPNGAGKSTAVRILTTVLRPDAGSVRIGSIDALGDPQRTRELIGLAGQAAAVDDLLTARENLHLVSRLTHVRRSWRRRRVDELLEQFDLAGVADRPVRGFSGGMRRRLDLAAALVHRPPVVVLDEPTPGLDPRARQSFYGVLEDLVADGVTLLLTTQYLEEADRLADRVAIIDHGRIVARGSPAELKASTRRSAVRVEVAAADLRRAVAVAADHGPAEVDTESRTVGLVLEGPSTLVALLRQLETERVEVISVDVRQPTLDDVFLQATGASTLPGASDVNTGTAA